MSIVSVNGEWRDAFEFAERIYKQNESVNGAELDELDVILAARNSNLIRYDPFNDTYVFIDQCVQMNDIIPSRLRGIADLDINPIKESTMKVFDATPLYITATPLVVVPPSTILLYNHDHVKSYDETAADLNLLKKAKEQDMRPGAEMMYKHRDDKVYRVLVLKEITAMENLKGDITDMDTRKYKVLFLDSCQIHTMKLRSFYLSLIGSSVADIPCAIIACRFRGSLMLDRDFIGQYEEQLQEFKKREANRVQALVYFADQQEQRLVVDFPALDGSECTEAERIADVEGFKALNSYDPPCLSYSQLQNGRLPPRFHPKCDPDNDFEITEPEELYVPRKAPAKPESLILSPVSTTSNRPPIVDSPPPAPAVRQPEKPIRKMKMPPSIHDPLPVKTRQAATDSHNARMEILREAAKTESLASNSPRKHVTINVAPQVVVDKSREKYDSSEEEDIPPSTFRRPTVSDVRTPVKLPPPSCLKDQKKEVRASDAPNKVLFSDDVIEKKTEKSSSEKRDDRDTLDRKPSLPDDRTPAKVQVVPETPKKQEPKRNNDYSDDEWDVDSDVQRDTELSHHMQVSHEPSDIDERPQGDVMNVSVPIESRGSTPENTKKIAESTVIDQDFSKNSKLPWVENADDSFYINEQEKEVVEKQLKRMNEKELERDSDYGLIDPKVDKDSEKNSMDSEDEIFLSDAAEIPQVFKPLKPASITSDSETEKLPKAFGHKIVKNPEQVIVKDIYQEVEDREELKEIAQLSDSVKAYASDEERLGTPMSVADVVESDAESVIVISEETKMVADKLRRKIIIALDQRDYMRYSGYCMAILVNSEVSPYPQFWEDELKWAKRMDSPQPENSTIEC